MQSRNDTSGVRANPAESALRATTDDPVERAVLTLVRGELQRRWKVEMREHMARQAEQRAERQGRRRTGP